MGKEQNFKELGFTSQKQYEDFRQHLLNELLQEHGKTYGYRPGQHVNHAFNSRQKQHPQLAQLDVRLLFQSFADNLIEFGKDALPGRADVGDARHLHYLKNQARANIKHGIVNSQAVVYTEWPSYIERLVKEDEMQAAASEEYKRKPSDTSIEKPAKRNKVSPEPKATSEFDMLDHIFSTELPEYIDTDILKPLPPENPDFANIEDISASPTASPRSLSPVQTGNNPESVRGNERSQNRLTTYYVSSLIPGLVKAKTPSKEELFQRQKAFCDSFLNQSALENGPWGGAVTQSRANPGNFTGKQ